MDRTIGRVLGFWGGCAALGAAVGLARGLRARFDLAGRVVLVTGGSRGLGLLLARQLARRGARLAICARDARELEVARVALVALGTEVEAIPCDLGEPDQVGAMVDGVETRLGPIDVLVNNAGIIQVGPLETMIPDDFEETMRANFWGTLYPTLAVLPGMRARGEGRIVNITSIGGKIAVPHLLPYSCAKFAAVGFSEGLAAEVAGQGIRVTTIVPGLMRTGSYLQARFKGRREAEATWFSLGASLPGISISARRAARRIVLALERGETFVTLGLPAKLLRVLHAALPGATVRIMSLINRTLPRADGALDQVTPTPGWLHQKGLATRALTALGRSAARANNELPGHPR
jgi:NAD(P)-dependent dehydrogenase (short-subunit alcohol dehydrogenase family)